MHINDYWTHMFHDDDGPIRQEVPGTGYYDQWTMECECGIQCTEVIIAAKRFMEKLDPAVDMSGILNATREHCQIICYG